MGRIKFILEMLLSQQGYYPLHEFLRYLMFDESKKKKKKLFFRYSFLKMCHKPHVLLPNKFHSFDFWQYFKKIHETRLYSAHSCNVIFNKRVSISSQNLCFIHTKTNTLLEFQIEKCVTHINFVYSQQFVAVLIVDI